MSANILKYEKINRMEDRSCSNAVSSLDSHDSPSFHIHRIEQEEIELQIHFEEYQNIERRNGRQETFEQFFCFIAFRKLNPCIFHIESLPRRKS